MILLIDNYDSFVHNLARYLHRCGYPTSVVRNDAVDVSTIRDMAPAAVVISPGPCGPSQAGCCVDVVRQLYQEFPILGICLGHQVIGQALGGQIARSRTPMHGRQSNVWHDGQHEFVGLPQPFAAGRYHSLVVEPDTLPDCLEVSAKTEDGTVMAVRNRQFPVVGWQFHPESILTENGYQLLAGFLKLAGLDVARSLPTFEDECRRETPANFQSPDQPVTF